MCIYHILLVIASPVNALMSKAVTNKSTKLINRKWRVGARLA